MNRIILIGNGFDLAHDLKTSYNDFIDDFWKEKIEKFLTEPSKFNDSDIEIAEFNQNLYHHHHHHPQNPINTLDEFTGFLQSKDLTIKYKNNFLGTITRKRLLQNWVDIEEEYYVQLKRILKNQRQEITHLNCDFDNIKNALKQYLQKVTESITCDEKIEKIEKIESQIYNEFDLRDITSKGVERIIEEQWVHYQELLKEKEKKDYTNNDNREDRLLRQNAMDRNSFNQLIMDKLQIKNYFWLIPDSILFLNFNYTCMENFYTNSTFQKTTRFYAYDWKINKEVIHIHGELKQSQSDNPIIFGYGDEFDKEYPTIEQLNDNNFLENVKSINYSRSDSYKRLLNYINSDNYQIFIFGHSCGISDRTLLNTLFEHENCVSIKAFYRVKEDGTNNFDDIIKNISRNFTNKAVMREKVVNKMYSESFVEK